VFEPVFRRVMRTTVCDVGHDRVVSHPEQQRFLALVASANHTVLEGGRVLEVGSYDVNGTVRRAFGAAADYVGVDLAPGPGVDRVGYGHEIEDPVASYDLAISGECFEHDPHWRDTFSTMVRVVRPGGLVAFTCASIGRPEHGTIRSDPSLSPGTQSRGWDYYQNRQATDFEDLPLSEFFEQWRFWEMRTSQDLFFAGVRAGADDRPRASLPLADDVDAIARLMSWPHRALRWPLRWATRNGESMRYQDRIRPYWRSALWLGDAVGRVAPWLRRRS
jgi:SAM-dependent methyltransferase